MIEASYAKRQRMLAYFLSLAYVYCSRAIVYTMLLGTYIVFQSNVETPVWQMDTIVHNS